jgi:hypothetical protein
MVDDADADGKDKTAEIITGGLPGEASYMPWLGALRPERRRGSYPRCLLVTNGDAPTVAERLRSLVALPEVMISVDDRWMPWGLPRQRDDGSWDLAPTAEAELGKAASFLTGDERIALASWWLAVRHQRARTPNWDIASTCRVDGRRGLLLIEAKAHDAELNAEASGKRLGKHASTDSLRNHDRIEMAIAEANDGLAKATGLNWGLARDSHYQLSNRFAWSWKAAELGLCVVLVYLGFLNADG